MAEREFNGDNGARHPFVVTESATFGLVKIEGPDAVSVTMTMQDAELLARWFLRIDPYGPRKIQP